MYSGVLPLFSLHVSGIYQWNHPPKITSMACTYAYSVASNLHCTAMHEQVHWTLLQLT